MHETFGSLEIGGYNSFYNETNELSIKGFMPHIKKQNIEEKKATSPVSVYQVGLTVDNVQLVRLLGVHNYTSLLANVVLKEFIQNAFDAVRSAYQKEELGRGLGRIDVSLAPKSRMITVSDNGVGMAPHTVKDVFLRVGTSLKESLSTEDRSGGFGLAKLAFLFAGKEVTLKTVRNGIRTYIQTNGNELLSGCAQLNTCRTNERNGTSISVKFPKKIELSEGKSGGVFFHILFNLQQF